MKTLLTFILCLLSVPAFGQYRPNTYTTNRQAQADAYIISIVSGPTNGITATVATNIAAYQASLATNGLSAELWDWNDTTLEIFANGFKSGDQNLLLQAESDGDKVVFLGGMLGDGSPITNLNASSIASGTLADARLSTNVSTYLSTLTASELAYGDRVINAKRFGAIGDGVADDTAVLQALLNTNANSRILLPAGTYLCNLLVTNPGTRLSGESTGVRFANTTILKAWDTTKPIVQIGDDTAYLRGVVVENLYIEGNLTNETSLYITGGADHSLIENCYIWGSSSNAVKIVGGASYPIYFLNFNDCWIQTSTTNLEATVFIRQAEDANYSSAYVTAVYFNNCNIAQRQQATMTNALLYVDGVGVFFNNTYVDALYGYIELAQTMARTPQLHGANAYVDGVIGYDIVKMYDSETNLFARFRGDWQFSTGSYLLATNGNRVVIPNYGWRNGSHGAFQDSLRVGFTDDAHYLLQTNTVLGVWSKASGNYPIFVLNSSGLGLFTVLDSSGNAEVGLRGSGTTSFLRHSGDSYLIGGDVGVGSSAPTAALHVTNRQAQAQVFRVDAPSLTDAFSVNTSGQTIVGGAGLYGLLPSGEVTNAVGSRVVYESDIAGGSGQTNNVVLAPGSNVTINTNTSVAGTTLYTVNASSTNYGLFTYEDTVGYPWLDGSSTPSFVDNVGLFGLTNLIHFNDGSAIIFSDIDAAPEQGNYLHDSRIIWEGDGFGIGSQNGTTNNVAMSFHGSSGSGRITIPSGYTLYAEGGVTTTNGTTTVGTMYAASVTGNGNGLTNLSPANIVSGTFSGALYTTASTASNSPAQNEIPTAGWVRGLFEGAGATYYATPFVATGTTNNSYDFGTNYILSTTAPADGSILVTGPTNGQYFMAFCTTNRFLQIRSGIGINAYLFSLNGGGSGGPQVNPEAYYSYDGTNWYGDWGAEAKYIPEVATTNLAQWIISNPSYTSTNATGFLVGGRMKMVTQTSPASDLVLAYGATFPSHMTLSIADTDSGNVYAAANNTFTGSNAFTGTLYPENGMTFKTNAMSGLVLALGQTGYTNLQSDITISGFSGGDHNYWRQGLLVVTNGTAAVHTITWPAGVRVLTNAITPNRVVYCTNSAVTMISYGVGFNMTNVAASGCYGQ